MTATPVLLARRVAAPTLLSAAALGTLNAAPALTSWAALRRPFPRLSGRGMPGGIGLTFDDGPDPLGTPAVLDALAALGWTATFFMLGCQARQYPEVARSVAAAGHEVAVHGDQHRTHLVRSAPALHRDISRARADIAEITGTRPRWFRPPYGVLTRGSLRAARSAGLTPVLWTSWGKDWQKSNPHTVLDHLLADLDDGGTVLLHDSDCTSTPRSWRNTVAALPLLAAELEQRGLTVRPLRDHLVERA